MEFEHVRAAAMLNAEVLWAMSQKHLISEQLNRPFPTV